MFLPLPDDVALGGNIYHMVSNINGYVGGAGTHSRKIEAFGDAAAGFCLNQWFTTPFNTPWPPCREANSTGPSTVLHLGDDADNFLEDPEVVARAGLITERLGYFRYDGMCENQM